MEEKWGEFWKAEWQQRLTGSEDRKWADKRTDQRKNEQRYGRKVSGILKNDSIGDFRRDKTSKIRTEWTKIRKMWKKSEVQKNSKKNLRPVYKGIVTNLWIESEKLEGQKSKQNVRRTWTKIWKKSEYSEEKKQTRGRKMSLQEKKRRMKKEKWAKIWKKSEFRILNDPEICNISQFCYNF